MKLWKLKTTSKRVSMLALSSAFVVGLTACGGGGGGTSSYVTREPGPIDGYLEGATCFYDADSDGVVDDTEISSKSVEADDGTTSCSLTTPGEVSISVSGGVDIQTGTTFTGLMTAPAGSSYITPLTTMIQSQIDAGSSPSDAKAAVASALGLESNTDLTAVNPLMDEEILTAQTAIIMMVKQVSALIEDSSTDPLDATSQNLLFASVTNSMMTSLSEYGAVDFTNSDSMSTFLSEKAISRTIDDLSTAESGSFAAALQTQTTGTDLQDNLLSAGSKDNFSSNLASLSGTIAAKTKVSTSVIANLKFDEHANIASMLSSDEMATSMASIAVQEKDDGLGKIIQQLAADGNMGNTVNGLNGIDTALSAIVTSVAGGSSTVDTGDLENALGDLKIVDSSGVETDITISNIDNLIGNVVSEAKGEDTDTFVVESGITITDPGGSSNPIAASVSGPVNKLLEASFSTSLDADNLSSVIEGESDATVPLLNFGLSQLPANSGQASVEMLLKDGTTETHTTGQRQLTVTYNLNWSSDGTDLTVTTPASGETSINYYTSTATSETEVTASNSAVDSLIISSTGVTMPVSLNVKIANLFNISGVSSVLDGVQVKGDYFYKIEILGIPLAYGSSSTDTLMNTVSGTFTVE